MAGSETKSRPRYLGELVESEAGEISDWHKHDFGQLVSSVAGSMYIGSQDKVLLLSAAMTIWVPPFAKHWMRHVSSNTMLFVDVSRSEARALGSSSRIMAMSPLLRTLVTATLPDAAGQRSARHNTAIHDLLRQEILCSKDVPLSLSFPKDRRIRAIARSAFENPGLIGSFDSWLKDAPASRKTVERLFVAETGLSPARWLRHARLLRAIALLSEGSQVSHVASDMGYDSCSSFTFMFRRTLGVSPTEFVKKEIPIGQPLV